MSALCPQSRNGECAAEDHLAIALHRDRIEDAETSLLKATVQGTVRIEPRNADQAPLRLMLLLMGPLEPS